MNIPALNERILRRDIAAGLYITGTDIQVNGIVYPLNGSMYPYTCKCMQVAILDEAVRLLPDAVWWIKADGVDVVSGISESVRLEWSGDVDLNDGEVQRVRAAYLNRLKFIENIGINKSNDQLQHDLTVLENELKKDLTFLSAGELPCICNVVHISILYFYGSALEDANGNTVLNWLQGILLIKSYSP